MLKDIRQKLAEMQIRQIVMEMMHHVRALLDAFQAPSISPISSFEFTCMA